MTKINKIIIAFAVLVFPFSAMASRSGVVVRHSDTGVKNSCVSYSEGSISSLELLQKAGFNPKSDNGFIVEVDGEKAKSAWEQGASNNYWSFWRLNNSNWIYSRGGASASSVSDGQTDGWQVGGSDLELASIHFDEICKPDVIAGNNPTDQPEVQIPTDTPATEKSSVATTIPKTISQETPLDSALPEMSKHAPSVKGETSRKKSYFLYILISCFVVGLTIPFLKRRQY